MRWLLIVLCLSAPLGCGSGADDADAGADGTVPGCACAPGQTGRRTQESACGDYEQTRACDGCQWLAWEGDTANCGCSPGEEGKEREVEGGEGCSTGVRVEREVCREDGSGYDWEAVSDYDGSLKPCEAGSTETREDIGECGGFTQSRACGDGCVPGEWVGTDDSCQCAYMGGTNYQACATPKGADCGWQFCSSAGEWFPCATNPNMPARCQTGSVCTPICRAGDVRACKGESVTLPCDGDRFKRCTCQSNGSFMCSLSCFG